MSERVRLTEAQLRTLADLSSDVEIIVVPGLEWRVYLARKMINYKTYQALKRSGLIEGRASRHGSSAIYYSITPAGRLALEAEDKWLIKDQN